MPDTNMDCGLPAPPSMEFSRLYYWSGLPFPSPVILTQQCKSTGTQIKKKKKTDKKDNKIR